MDANRRDHRAVPHWDHRRYWSDPWEAKAPSLSVDALADADIVGTLLGPDGRPLHTVTRPRPPFGYARPTTPEA